MLQNSNFIVSINEDPLLSENCNVQNSEIFRQHNFPNSLDIKAKNNSTSNEIKLERKTNLPKNIPQFLVKFSASYFQVADFKKEVVFGILKHKLQTKPKHSKTKNEKKKGIPKIGEFSNLELTDLQKKNSSLKKYLQTPHNIEKKREKNDFSEDSQSLSQIINMTESEKSFKLCVICCDKVPDAVLMECGHGGSFKKN